MLTWSDVTTQQRHGVMLTSSDDTTETWGDVEVG